MSRKYGDRFPDGTTWNSTDSYRLFFQDLERYNYGPQPSHRRNFRAIGRVEEIDARLRDIQMLAYQGHMNPYEFRAVEITNTNLIELRFETNYYCQLVSGLEKIPGHDILHRTLYWVRMSNGQEMTICDPCYRLALSHTPFLAWKVLP